MNLLPFFLLETSLESHSLIFQQSLIKLIKTKQTSKNENEKEKEKREENTA